MAFFKNLTESLLKKSLPSAGRQLFGDEIRKIESITSKFDSAKEILNKSKADIKHTTDNFEGFSKVSRTLARQVRTGKFGTSKEDEEARDMKAMGFDFGDVDGGFGDMGDFSMDSDSSSSDFSSDDSSGDSTTNNTHNQQINITKNTLISGIKGPKNGISNGDALVGEHIAHSVAVMSRIGATQVSLLGSIAETVLQAQKFHEDQTRVYYEASLEYYKSQTGIAEANASMFKPMLDYFKDIQEKEALRAEKKRVANLDITETLFDPERLMKKATEPLQMLFGETSPLNGMLKGFSEDPLGTIMGIGIGSFIGHVGDGFIEGIKNQFDMIGARAQIMFNSWANNFDTSMMSKIKRSIGEWMQLNNTAAPHLNVGRQTDLDSSAIFDNRVHKTIVDVIPMYLGKILHAIKGSPAEGPEVYDFTSNRFKSSAKVGKELKVLDRELNTANFHGGIGRGSQDTLNSVFDNETMSKRQKMEISKAMLGISLGDEAFKHKDIASAFEALKDQTYQKTLKDGTVTTHNLFNEGQHETLMKHLSELKENDQKKFNALTKSFINSRFNIANRQDAFVRENVNGLYAQADALANVDYSNKHIDSIKTSLSSHNDRINKAKESLIDAGIDIDTPDAKKRIDKMVRDGKEALIAQYTGKNKKLEEGQQGLKIPDEPFKLEEDSFLDKTRNWLGGGYGPVQKAAGQHFEENLDRRFGGIFSKMNETYIRFKGWMIGNKEAAKDTPFLESIKIGLNRSLFIPLKKFLVGEERASEVSLWEAMKEGINTKILKPTGDFIQNKILIPTKKWMLGTDDESIAKESSLWNATKIAVLDKVINPLKIKMVGEDRAEDMTFIQSATTLYKEKVLEPLNTYFFGEDKRKNGFFENVWNKFSPILNKIFFNNDKKGFLDNIKDKFKEFGDYVSDKFITPFKNTIKETFGQPLKDFFKNIGGEISHYFKKFKDGVISSFKEGGKVVAKTIFGDELIKQVRESIVDPLKELTKTLGEQTSKITRFILRLPLNLLKGISNSIQLKRIKEGRSTLSSEQQAGLLALQASGKRFNLMDLGEDGKGGLSSLFKKRTTSATTSKTKDPVVKTAEVVTESNTLLGDIKDFLTTKYEKSQAKTTEIWTSFKEESGKGFDSLKEKLSSILEVQRFQATGKGNAAIAGFSGNEVSILNSKSKADVINTKGILSGNTKDSSVSAIRGDDATVDRITTSLGKIESSNISIDAKMDKLIEAVNSFGSGDTKPGLGGRKNFWKNFLKNPTYWIHQAIFSVIKYPIKLVTNITKRFFGVFTHVVKTVQKVVGATWEATKVVGRLGLKLIDSVMVAAKEGIKLLGVAAKEGIKITGEVIRGATTLITTGTNELLKLSSQAISGLFTITGKIAGALTPILSGLGKAAGAAIEGLTSMAKFLVSSLWKTTKFITSSLAGFVGGVYNLLTGRSFLRIVSKMEVNNFDDLITRSTITPLHVRVVDGKIGTYQYKERGGLSFIDNKENIIGANKPKEKGKEEEGGWLSGISKFLGSILGTIGGGGILGVIGKVMLGFKGIFGSVLKAVAGLATSVMGKGAVGKGLGALIDGVAGKGGGKGVIKALGGSLGKLSKGLGKGLPFAAGGLLTVASNYAFADDTEEDLSNLTEDERNAKSGEKLGSSIGSVLGGGLGMLFGPVGSIVGGFIGDSLGGFVGKLVGGAWNTIKDGAKSLGKRIYNPDMTFNWEKLQVVEQNRSLIGTLANLTLLPASAMKQGMTFVMEKLGGAFNFIWEGLKNNKIVRGMADFLGIDLDKGLSGSSVSFEKAQSKGDRERELQERYGMMGKGESAIQAVKDSVASLPGRAASAVQSVGGAISNAASYVGNGLANLVGWNYTTENDHLLYRMGGNGVNGIDCSNWTTKLNNQLVNQINMSAGSQVLDPKDYTYKVSADQITYYGNKYGVVADSRAAGGFDASKVTNGMLLGQWKKVSGHDGYNKSLNGFGPSQYNHVAAVVSDGNQLMVSESIGPNGKNGVTTTPLNRWLQQKLARGDVITAVNPFGSAIKYLGGSANTGSVTGMRTGGEASNEGSTNKGPLRAGGASYKDIISSTTNSTYNVPSPAMMSGKKKTYGNSLGVSGAVSTAGVFQSNIDKATGKKSQSIKAPMLIPGVSNKPVGADIGSDTYAPSNSKLNVNTLFNPVNFRRNTNVTPSGPASGAKLDAIINTVADQHQIPRDLMHAMAVIESGKNPNVANKFGYKGLYQFGAAAWKESLPGVPFSQWNDPMLNSHAAANYMTQNAQGLAKSGLPVSPFTLYMAHQQGLGGLRAAFKAADNGGPATGAMLTNWPTEAGAKGTGGARGFIQGWVKRLSNKLGTGQPGDYTGSGFESEANTGGEGQAQAGEPSLADQAMGFLKKFFGEENIATLNNLNDKLSGGALADKISQWSSGATGIFDKVHTDVVGSNTETSRAKAEVVKVEATKEPESQKIIEAQTQAQIKSDTSRVKYEASMYGETTEQTSLLKMLVENTKQAPVFSPNITIDANSGKVSGGNAKVTINKNNVNAHNSYRNGDRSEAFTLQPSKQAREVAKLNVNR